MSSLTKIPSGVRYFFYLSLVLSFLLSIAFGDSWNLPEKKEYCSANKKYCLEVIPKKLESQLQYFQEKASGQAQLSTTVNVCKATFRAVGRLGVRRSIATFPLLNEVAPVHVLVSDDGKYVVTFDNWHSVGYGPNVIVIYRSDGSLVKNWSLEELFTENDLGTFPETTSSRYWGTDHFLDEKNGWLVLELSGGEPRPYVTRPVPSRPPLRIELATGKPLWVRQDFLPRYDFCVSVNQETPKQPAATNELPLPADCFLTGTRISGQSGELLSATDLVKQAIKKSDPLYPPIAKAAHATGTVSLQVVVSDAGEVICASIISGHPLLKGAAVSAVRQWKFSARAEGAEKRLRHGGVSFRFERIFFDPLDEIKK